MDNIYVIIFIVIPISMFGAGFLVSRQLRALENVPIFSMLFVQRRLLFSLIMGFFISLTFTAILGLADGFTPLLFLSFFGIFLLATFSYYFGVNFGWGKSESFGDSILTTTSQAETDTSFPENLLVENSLASIKVTINSKKKMGVLYDGGISIDVYWFMWFAYSEPYGNFISTKPFTRIFAFFSLAFGRRVSLISFLHKIHGSP
jgi:hypothetical protein